ncbi:MAG: glutamate racemase [Gemmatimonadetes bacterium]|nr:glutamate racemase [Gemmatimonadota bacterium]
MGVFDSGLGGLTVVKELVRRLPQESVLYLGDTARVPYGTKSPETIRRFSREAAHFLLGRDVKMIVVACNTATAHALDVLVAESPVPVVGVIEAGARAAHHASESGRIGVIGTTGTIASGAYDRAVRRLRGPAVEVYAQACPLFVPLVEDGLAEHQAARLIAQDYLAPLHEVGIDTLVLGCTHYPAMRETIAGVMGQAVRLIDSGEETALDVARILSERDLLAPADHTPTRMFSVTDLPLRFRTVGRLLVGDMIESVEHVQVEGALERVP